MVLWTITYVSHVSALVKYGTSRNWLARMLGCRLVTFAQSWRPWACSLVKLVTYMLLQAHPQPDLPSQLDLPRRSTARSATDAVPTDLTLQRRAPATDFNYIRRVYIPARGTSTVPSGTPYQTPRLHGLALASREPLRVRIRMPHCHSTSCHQQGMQQHSRPREPSHQHRQQGRPLIDSTES